MESSARGNEALARQQKDYAAFEEKVKRTVYLDNLSPLVTVPILKTALGQFGTVVDAQVCPNHLDPKNASVSALVEMQSEREASSTVTEVSVNPFMIAGMPRPARARRAEAAMFPERPAPPGRRIQCYWVDSSDPDWEVALQLKQLAKKHAAEASYLQKYQREEEEKLGDQQEESFKTIYKKYEMIEGIYVDGTAERLRRRYNLRELDS
eukprot:Gb_17103 [translate_table: standard]